MDKFVIEKLKKIVGIEYVLESKEECSCYAYDATFKRGVPVVVVLPGSTEEVAKIIQLANQEGFPVFPRGAGTGLSGGSIPLENGVALVMTRFNRIKEIHQEDLLAVVEPGVITGVLQEAVENVSLFYPPDPASSKVCTIGGNVAENAGGPRAFKYGITKNFILGLEIVTPTGEVIRTGGRTVKNVTGYDLTGLIVGSEGTLGIVTEIIVRLLPKPEHTETALVVFSSLEDAAKTVTAIINRGVIPSTLELMDRTTISCVQDYTDLGLPSDTDAILLIESDGSPEQVKAEMIKIREICLREGCSNVEIAEEKKDRDRLWTARRAVSSALVKLKPTKISEDATVPRSKIPEMVKRLRLISEKYGLFLPVFGHAGDGNLHPNIIADKQDHQEMERVEKAVAEIFAAALDLGGTLSGEHGIGLMKKAYLESEVGSAGIKYMQSIKKALDPNWILNPGKVFDHYE